MAGWATPELISSLVGVGTLFTGYRLSRLGSRDTARQQEVANHIAEQHDAFERMERINDRLQSQADREAKRADVAEERARREAEAAAKDRREAAQVIALLRKAVLSEAAEAAALDPVTDAELLRAIEDEGDLL